jgi:hypothetical protein
MGDLERYEEIDRNITVRRVFTRVRRGVMDKIVWKIAEAPTGRYRAFVRREWPTAYYGSTEGKPAAFLVCDDDYRPDKVRTGQHRPITIIMLHHTHPGRGASWKRFRMKETADTLDRAKVLVQTFLDKHPEFRPVEETK